MVKELDIIPDFTPREVTIPPIHCFQYQKTLKDELRLKFNKEHLFRMLETLLYIRYFEEMIVELRDGKYTPKEGFKFVGATHLSIGQESVAVGTMANLNPNDYITSTHRGHGHAIAKGLWALYRMSTEEICRFLDKDYTGQSHEEILNEAIYLHLLKTTAELFGKEIGYCHGRGGGMHIADFNVGHLGANAIVGGSFAIASGAALAESKLKRGRVVVCLVGDGALHNGISHEAMNFATQKQFESGLPVIFVIENNQYAMTAQTIGEVTGIDFLARRGAGLSLDNMHAEVVDGMNVLAVHDAVKRAVNIVNECKGPVLLECMTYRYMGHSLSDNRTAYRADREENAWKSLDSIRRLEHDMQLNNLLSIDETEKLHQRIKRNIHFATEKALNSEDPDPRHIYNGLYTNTTESNIPEKFSKVSVLKPPRRFIRDSKGRIMYRHAVQEALTEEMIRDNRVVLYGEDVADYGGAFQATVGLMETFGRNRVFNAPISEAAIVGTGCGAAMAGLRPVVEIMYIDFMPLALDQLGNQVAKTRYMFGGKAEIPLVIRTTIGGGKGYAGQHSQSLEALITQFPGLKVVAPSTAYDLKGLLKMSIRDNNPVVFIEHQLLYTEKDIVPEEEYLIPIGEGRIRKEGNDLTIISYLNMVNITLKAAELLNKEDGASIEVIDPRTLIPLDIELLIRSTKKTGRVMVVLQAPQIGCFGEHILYEIQKRAFNDLKAPLKIVGARNVPPPMAHSLEIDNIPSVERIVSEARELLSYK